MAQSSSPGGSGFRLDDSLVVGTAEGVEFELTLAGVGSRGAAALIDGLIQFLAVFFVTVIFGMAGAGGISIAIYVVATFVLIFCYGMLSEALWSGKTVGKRAIGLRVTTLAGAKPGLGPIAVRNLLRIVDFLPFGYGIGVLSILMTNRRQSIGDLAAGTVVLSSRLGARAHLRGAFQPQSAQASVPYGFHPTDGWDVSQLTQQDVAAIRHLFARRWDLPHSTWEGLCHTFATRIRPTVSGGDGLPDDQFLIQVVEAKRRR